MSSDDLKTFLVRYHYDGGSWGLQIKAYDYEDARLRLARLQHASIDGELISTIPASFGPTAPILSALRNAWFQLLGRS